MFLGVTAIRSMPADIFPVIDIPVVTGIWQYTGLSTPEMEQRVTTYSEYSISSNVNGIKDIEAQTLAGISVQKIFFQPDVNLDLAISQIVAGTNAVRALMPTGIEPPIVVQYNASSVPVLQISLSSDTLSEQQLYDYGLYTLRQRLAPIHGVTFPTPAGGKYRQIMVDLDPAKLLARGLTPTDVVNAVNAQSLTLPSGTAKIGTTQYVGADQRDARRRSADLNNIPIKYADGATIFVKDVANVRDGSLVQQNIVRADGRRSVLLSVISNGNASTLDVVNQVKAALKVARASAPPGMKIEELLDQSVFVSAAVDAVVREGAIAAGLTALMILLFLGSWRSTLVVMISIPLSILSSLVVLYLLGDTLNTMTLGGLALAVGILVDDSTVTIENTHRLLTEEHMPLPQATLYGAAGIAVPTLVSTLAISCVIDEHRRAERQDDHAGQRHDEAVVQQTPQQRRVTLAHMLETALERMMEAGEPIAAAGGRLAMALALEQHADRDRRQSPRKSVGREHREDDREAERREEVFRQAFEKDHRGKDDGRDFFPLIDGGQIELHVRAPPGTRIETTEQVFQAVENKIREIIPESDRQLIVDNIGLPARVYNLAFNDGTTIGLVNDGQIFDLAEGRPRADC